MTKEDIFDRLSNIIAEVTGFEPEEISEEDSLSEDIGIESFDIVDINFRVEEVFGVQIGPGTFWNFKDMFENPEWIDENNLLTLKGIQEMKKRIPNLDKSNHIELTRSGNISFTEMLGIVKVKHFVVYIQLNMTKE